MSSPSKGFRIFISYSHHDKHIAKAVVDALEELELYAIWDENILPGAPFSDAIKDCIAQSHVFMPIITERSQDRPWVHQETGYAMALRIPVVPLAVGDLPGAMIEELQAVPTTEDPEEISNCVKNIDYDLVVCPPPPGPRTIIQVAEWPETRTELMAQYANRVIELGNTRKPNHGRLRQRGGISSFGIPDEPIESSTWNDREHGFHRSDYYHFLQREERRALEKHAKNCGMYLIIDPSFELKRKRISAGVVRMTTLLEFLHACRSEGAGEKYQVVIHERALGANMTIVGDWFAAESRVPRPGKGYEQTIFTSHAPTVRRIVNEFDQRFEEILAERNWMPAESLNKAIEEVEGMLEIAESLLAGKKKGKRPNSADSVAAANGNKKPVAR